MSVVLLFTCPFPYIVHSHPKLNTMPSLASLASLANAAPAFEVLIIIGDLLSEGPKCFATSLATFILKDGALEAIQATGMV